jgi:voltage-gated potassium channel Kch
MVLLFGIWMVGLILGFGLLLWAAHVNAGITPRSTLGSHLYMSGVTFFTVGYGDLVPQTRLGRLISVLEVGTGLGNPARDLARSVGPGPPRHVTSFFARITALKMRVDVHS